MSAPNKRTASASEFEISLTRFPLVSVIASGDKTKNVE